MTSADAQPPIRCFLSYAHDDDENLNFVDDFKKSLAHFTHANSGRRLEIFVDHDSIGWGEEWRESIRDSIDTALVFIPLVTLQYLDRPMCREEVMLFFEGARTLGVTELFLPVVVLGHRAIREESADPVAARIAQRQYKDLKDAVLQGAGTPTWRASLLDLSEALIEAVDKAEERLQDARRDDPSSAGSQPEELEDDAPGLLELSDDAEMKARKVGELIEEFGQLLNDIPAQLSPLTDRLSGSNQQRARLILMQIADSLREKNKRADAVGTALEVETSELDSTIRNTWNLLRYGGSDELKRGFKTAVLGEDGDNLAGLEETVSTMDEMLEQMKGVEVLSVPLRKSMKPLRKGVTSAKTAMMTTSAWRELLDEDAER